MEVLCVLNSNFNKDRLKEARMYRGLSLEELGEALGVSKQMISKFEQDLAVPNAEQLFLLVQKLSFPKSFFYTNDVFNYSRGNPYFRALMSVSKREKVRQLMKVENIASLRDFIELEIEFPKVSLPDLSNFGEGVEEKALRLREVWELGERPINNMLELLEEKGIVVTELRVSDESVDAFSQRISLNKGDSSATYYVVVLGSNKKSFYRRQFDAAHELAHLLLHESIDDIEELNNVEFKAMEREADKFAGSLLLPAKEFKMDVSVSPTNLAYYKELKSKWKVSIGAMVVRARQLDVINGEEYQSLFKAMSRKGWRKEEPLDALTPLVSASAFKEGLDLLFEEGLYTSESFLRDFSAYSGRYLNYSEIEKLLNLEEGYFSKYIVGNSKLVSLKHKV